MPCVWPRRERPAVGIEPVRSSRNLQRHLGLLLLTDAGALVLAGYGRKWVALDRCLDAGLVYDYREERCRTDVIHLTHAASARRQPALLAEAGVLVVFGVGLIALGRRFR